MDKGRAYSERDYTPEERLVNATGDAIGYVLAIMERGNYTREGLVREALELRAVKSLSRSDRETVRDAVSLVLKLR